MDTLVPFLTTVGKIFGIFLGIFVAFVLALVVYVDIWLKFYVKGKIVAIFADNRSIFSALLSVEDSTKVFYGRGDKKEEYLLDDKKQYLSLFPAGLPRFLQVTVRTFWYIRNQPAPIDPANAAASPLTSRMLRMVTDEAMVKQTWKDVREAQGLNKAKSSGSLALYLVIGCLGLIIFNLYLTMNNQSVINAIHTILTKVYGQ